MLNRLLLNKIVQLHVQVYDIKAAFKAVYKAYVISKTRQDRSQFSDFFKSKSRAIYRSRYANILGINVVISCFFQVETCVLGAQKICLIKLVLFSGHIQLFHYQAFGGEIAFYFSI